VKLLGYRPTLRNVIRSSAKRELDFSLGSGTVLSVMYEHVQRNSQGNYAKSKTTPTRYH
jgi:hypothetical protein